METRRIKLRRMLPEDYSFLYELATSQDAGYRWRYFGSFPTYDSFVQTLSYNKDPQFVVLAKDGEPAGWVLSYRFDPANGTVYMGIIMSHGYLGGGAGIEAAASFLEYLFKFWNLRKVYTEAPGYTYESVGSGLGSIFREEGVLRDHRYFDGRFWDEHIIAVYREDWEKIKLRLPWLREQVDTAQPPGAWWAGSS